MERPILRAQLALLYSGFFLGLLVVALGAAGLLILSGSQSAAHLPSPSREAAGHAVRAGGVAFSPIR